MSGLVLSRRVGESVTVRHAGTELRIVVTELHGTQVKLAFIAPREVTVFRSEVQDAIDRERGDD